MKNNTTNAAEELEAARAALEAAKAEIEQLKAVAAVAVRQSGNIRTARATGKIRRMARINELLGDGNRTREELVAELINLGTGVSEATIRTEITDSANPRYAGAGLLHLTRRVGEVVGFVDDDGAPLHPFPSEVKRRVDEKAAPKVAEIAEKAGIDVK